MPETLAEALTPTWLTAALRTRYPDINVTEVIPGPVISRVATNGRFRIAYTGAASDGPRKDLCVKGYFTEAGRDARHAGIPEVSFYRDLATDSGVRTLRRVYADVDPVTQASVLITEDVVADGAVFLDPLSEYSPDQAASSLDELAKLHAATWLNPSYADAGWLAPWLTVLAQGRGIPVIEGNFAGPIGAGVPAPVRNAQQLFDAYANVARSAATSMPWSVIHGDAHVGNLFLDSDGRPSFVDWQLVRRGPWYLDVGYHLASTLTVKDRRREEGALVRHYLDQLAGSGIELPSEAEIWRGLRQGFVHGFFLWAITLKVDPAITTELLERLGTAVDDHGALR